MLTTCKWFQITLDKELILCTVFRTNFVYTVIFLKIDKYIIITRSPLIPFPEWAYLPLNSKAMTFYTLFSKNVEFWVSKFQSHFFKDI